MKNRKKLFLFLIVIAIIVFITLFFIFYYRESSLLDSKDKKWLNDNGKKIINIEVFNDVSVFGKSGNGVVFNFLDYVSKETEVQFNKIPYSKEEATKTTSYRMEIVDGSTNLNSNQLFFYEDTYVAISKKNTKINKISDFSSTTIGVLQKDESNISY